MHTPRSFPGKSGLVIALTLIAAACEPAENPQVIPEVTSRCGVDERLVTDVCTRLGADDGCVDVDDVCIALCDGLESCTTVSGELRVLSAWPVAPRGYCVECAIP
jgi:hypothetical protein